MKVMIIGQSTCNIYDDEKECPLMMAKSSHTQWKKNVDISVSCKEDSWKTYDFPNYDNKNIVQFVRDNLSRFILE